MMAIVGNGKRCGFKAALDLIPGRFSRVGAFLIAECGNT